MNFKKQNTSRITLKSPSGDLVAEKSGVIRVRSPTDFPYSPLKLPLGFL